MTTTVPAPPPEPVNGTRTSLEKIESFLSDATYKEALENSVNYNTRLCIERRLRLPFIDTQTGVAQNHSALFMNRRQRIPGLLPGQIYTYPRQRWRKRRRQYLTMNARAFARAADHLLDGESDMHSISTMENPALQDTDSKDSQLLLKDEVSKEWFYDEADMLEMDAYDEPDPDSDLDYEETYSKRRKGRRGTGRGRSGTDSPSTPGRKKGAGRGRKKAAGHSFEPTPGDPDKPFACERTPSRNKARQTPGMPPSPVMGTAGPPPQSQAPPNLPPSLPPVPTTVPTDDPPMPVLMPEKSMEPIVLNPGPSVPVESITSPVAPAVDDTKKPTISPYCDFCLGLSRENKKTGTQEDLVSCSDCGRSGHPTCLQFTDNMKISVKKYRWQCIECKCCSVCGTSDNDDQLLFCDDCDRGYHMYCLSPALVNPPEGSWSCKLCIDQFHK